MRQIWLCLLLFAALLPSPTASGDEPRALTLRPDMTEGLLVGVEDMRLHIAPGGVGIAALLADDQANEPTSWQAPASNVLSLELDEQAAWVRLTVVNPAETPGRWVLEVRWPHIHSAIAWRVKGDEVTQLGGGGLGHPLTGDGDSRTVAVPFELAAGEAADLYLEVRDPTRVHLPLMLWSSAGYAAEQAFQLLFVSTIVGILLAMALYNASLYIFTRDRMYLFYTNVVVSTGLYLLAVSGVGRVYVWGHVPWLDAHSFSLFASYAFLSVTYFFREFLELPRYGGWVLHANSVFLVVWALVMFASLAGAPGPAMLAAGPIGLLVVMVGLATAAVLWVKGSRAAKFFCISWSLLTVATVCTIAVMIGVVPYFPAVDQMQGVGFAVEVVLLSIALADRINGEREAREQAQALALQRQAEVLELTERANSELEDRVRVRTVELRSALEELEHVNGELSRLTLTDPLTRMPNRRHFDQISAREIANAARLQRPLAVLVIDLDHFKAVNDNYGHAAGDRCLQLAGEAIANTASRPGDAHARIGGEEFAAVLPNTDLDSARRVAERIRGAIEDISMVHAGAAISITTSVGVAGRVVGAGDSMEDLLIAADQALYRAKAAGRNRVEVATPEELEPASRRDGNERR